MSIAVADDTCAQGAWRAYWQRVASLLQSRWQLMLAFVLLLVTLDFTRAWSVEVPTTLPTFLENTLRGNIYQILGAGGAIAGSLLGAGCARRGWSAALLIGTCTILGVALSFACYMSLNQAIVYYNAARVLSETALVTRGIWFYSVAGMLFATYCAVRERHMSTVRALQAAELERASIQRQMLESRLMVLQARIEPEFLFKTLEAVWALYRRSPSVAGHMLDELILYLRAALPQMRGETSTVGQEMELVRAYVSVLNATLDDPAQIEIDIDEATAGQPFPPMILLPIVQAAVAASMESRKRVALSVVLDGESARISVAIEGGAPPENWHDDAMARPRETLTAMCGPLSEIHFRSASGVHHATITVPISRMFPAVVEAA